MKQEIILASEADSTLTTQEWYQRMVEDCKDILVEGEFAARWIYIQTYWLVGQRICQEFDVEDRAAVYGKKIATRVSQSLGKSKRTIERAIQFHRKYPDPDQWPFDKAISWRRICREYLPEPTHRLISQSNSNEWYTPQQYLDAAREVMGGVDLDPASSALANERVRATRFFTAEDDGLKHDWAGRVWLNPPWGGLAARFVTRLVEEYGDGNVTEAIALVNAHSCDAQWFAPLWDYLLCFTDHRIDYTNPASPDAAGSTHGSVFVYMGDNHARFIEAFKQFGYVVRRVGA